MTQSDPNETGSESGSEAILTLCTQCVPGRFAQDLRHLEEALAAAGLEIALRGQDCLNCCAAPQAMALQGKGRATYVFHDLDVAEDLPDIVGTVRTWLDARDGWIVDAQGCGRLRVCLRARIRSV